MKVHIIKKQTIEDFVKKHARSRSSFSCWLTALTFADWNEPADMLKTFGTADILGRGSNRVVFDIAGNEYRMICKYVFGEKQVHLFISWIGTHAEYDKLCNNNEQYNISKY